MWFMQISVIFIIITTTIIHSPLQMALIDFAHDKPAFQ
jgi:hypothetical protein